MAKKETKSKKQKEELKKLTKNEIADKFTRKELISKLSDTKKIRQKTIQSALKFHQELKKSVNTAIVAAFGFIIALAWRDVITEYITKITEASPVHGKLIEALIITIISVLGILIVTKIFSKSEEEKK